MSRQALTDVILTVRFDVICSGWAHDVILAVRIYVIITATVTICVLGHLPGDLDTQKNNSGYGPNIIAFLQQTQKTAFFTSSS